jgi:hypothetical protein
MDGCPRSGSGGGSGIYNYTTLLLPEKIQYDPDENGSIMEPQVTHVD